MKARLAKTLTILGLVVATSAVLAPSGLASSPFKSGTYKGKTSQGSKFVAKVLVTPECDYGRVPCFYTIVQPEIKTTCPDGESDEYMDYLALKIPPSGSVKQTLTSGTGAKDTVAMHVSKNGTITGSFKITGERDSIDPEELTGYCSGSATFKLKRS